MFDLVVVLVLLVSGVIGFARGATRELVAVLSFLLAIAVAVFSLRVTAPIALRFVETEWMAKAAALLVVFLAAYIAVRIIGGGLARAIHETQLGVLDRVIGLGFGLVRGLALLGVFNLVLNAAIPAGSLPPWISASPLYPLTGASADVLRALAPKGELVAGQVAPALENAMQIKVAPAGPRSLP